MKIQTLRFGEIEVDEGELVAFPEGLPGFAKVRRFALLESPDIAPFAWLQSVEDASVSFVIVDPLAIYPDYRVQVHPDDIEGLELKDPGEAKVLAIVVVPSDPQRATVNLKGPIIVNPNNRKAKQVVLADANFSVRHPVWSQGTEQEDRSCSS